MHPAMMESSNLAAKWRKIMTIALALLLAFVVVVLALLAFAMLRSGGGDVISFMCLGIFLGAAIMFFMGMIIIS
jgi:hypothetical protein